MNGPSRPGSYVPPPGRRTGAVRQVLRLAEAAALVWRAAPRLVTLLAVLQVTSAASFGGVLLVARELVSQLLPAQQTHVGLPALLPALGLLAGLLLLNSLSGSFRESIRLVLTEQVSESAFQPVADVAAAIDLEAYESAEFHDRLQRALNAGSRPFQITLGMLQLGGSLTMTLGLVGLLLALQPLLVPALLVTLTPQVLSASAFSRDFRAFSVRQGEHERRRQYLRGLLTGTGQGEGLAKEVRAYDLAGHLRSRARELYEQRVAELWRVVRRGSARTLLGSAGSALAFAATLGVLTWFVLDRGMTFATAATAALAVVSMTPEMTLLAFGVGQLYESALFLEDLAAFRALLPVIGAARPDRPAPRRFQVLRLDDVSFTYPGSTRPALAGVSLTIRRGEVVALVGENGSGKTTLAKVLAGLYRPQGGRVCWDGQDLSEVDPDQLRRGIAVLFQDFGRYLFPVAENIGLGRVEAMDDRSAIEQAARRAGAHRLIARLPRGYDTMLGTMFAAGEDLSLGQWQRVALARAFFRDAPFIILDEPTAALDARAEHELFDGMRELFDGRTVLLISHRFSSVLSADRIFVLDAGRLVEQGTHAELMRAAGLYADLFALQALGRGG